MARTLAYCRGDGPCPAELEMAWAIRRFGTAAVLGDGVQDYGTLSAIAASENVWNAWQSWAAADDKTAWARKYPAADALLRELLAKIGL